MGAGAAGTGAEEAARTSFVDGTSAALVAVAIPATLGAWLLAAQRLALPVEWACQASLVSCMPTLVAAIFGPLWRGGGSPNVRRLAFLRNWFATAIFFNLVWQCPQLLLRERFRVANASLLAQPSAASNELLPYLLFWWGYSSADLDYRNQTDFFVLAELSYWPISLLALSGLRKVARGGEEFALGLLMLLVCGALQCYNVAFFIGYGYLCADRFQRTIAPGALPAFVYFFMNLLWGIAGAAAAFEAGILLLGLKPAESQSQGKGGKSKST
jgi:hypothetical protein